MKRFIALTIASLFATTAFADQSTYEEDLRLDTSLSGKVYAADAATTRPNGRPGDLFLQTFSADTRSVATLSSSGDRSDAGVGPAYEGNGPGTNNR